MTHKDKLSAIFITMMFIITLALLIPTKGEAQEWEDDYGEDLDAYLDEQNRAQENHELVREYEYEYDHRDRGTTFINRVGDTTIIQQLGGSNETTFCTTVGTTVICQ
jgi:hypothetical protein